MSSLNAKCFDIRKEIQDFINNNIVKILLSVTVAMIFLIANSQILIYAAISGTWLLSFVSLFVIGFAFAYVLISFIFRILGKQ